MPPVLEVRGLEVAFEGAAGPVTVVDGVDLAVGAGRTLCLVGESGCGKSVTALAVMRLLPRPPARVTAAALRLDGEELGGLDEEAMRARRGNRLAMIFQEPMTALNPAHRVGDQIAEAIRCHRPLPQAAVRAEVLELLRSVRIPDPGRRARQYPHQLSGGMRQRVTIAMALANRPRLLIADEPTTALDATVQAQILALIGRLREATGTAVLLITHDLGVVGEVADAVAVMYAGRIVEDGPAAAVLEDPQHPYTLGLLASLPERAEPGRPLLAIPGTVPPAGRWPPGCRFAGRCALAEPRCRAEPPPLRPIGPAHRVACWRAPIERAIARPAA